MFLKFQKVFLLNIFILSLFIALCGSAFAYDINEKLSVEGTLTGVYQYADLDVEGVNEADRGAVVFDLGTNFHPTEKDEFQITLSFAAGNGLNYMELFSLAPYADDLEDDLKDINGRNRDYLLEAWYKHTFKFSEGMSLGITGGIIDATVYIDDNNFANCECSQFMNEVFVNHKNVNLPSYDLGGAFELDIANFSIRGLLMNTKFDAGEESFTNYNYYAMQVGYKVEAAFGEGNYRLYGFTTSEKFECWDGEDEDSLQGFGISLDQKLGEVVGLFVRAGWQDDKAVIDHDEIYSSGLNINGKLWRRKDDEAGIGYAYLDGACYAGNEHTNVFETYVRVKISEYNDITFDIQYIDEDMKHDEDRDGFVYGVRLNAYF
jgi:porin